MTKEDVLQTALLTPGWYPCLVSDYAEKASKGDASLNRNITLRVSEGPSEGVQLKTLFNEKFAPLLPDYVRAFGADYEEGKTFDLEDTKGKKILVHVKRGEYNGRPQNEVDGFRAAA